MGKKLFYRILVLILSIFLLAGCSSTTSREPEVPASPASTTLNLAGDWVGQAEWPGLTFDISFSIAEGSSEVTDLRISLTCPGSTAPDGNYTFPSSMINANSFSAFGTAGKFISATEAEGTFNGGVRITCGQEEVPTQGTWTATRVTK
ncbi:MAG: hypothetical protein ABIJ65_01170 [Chloroflexota bacterium]